MKYERIRKAIFIDRPNRFIANIVIDGKREVCHVKNTGRCKELLVENAEIFVQEAINPARKTKYDLISVMKGERLVNIDSQAPNKVFYEWLMNRREWGELRRVRPEFTYNNSRFDFLIETDTKRILAEVKGVTLEEGGVVSFPDAPTERGVKHVTELAESIEDGFFPLVVFVIQMKNVLYFTPNAKTHQAFADALKEASRKGVELLAVDCLVTQDSMTMKDFVKIVL